MSDNPPDGDSTMNSSPEVEPSDDMFPDEASPSTPKAPNNPASELSPPSTQEPSQAVATASLLNENGKRVLRPSGTVGGEAGAGAIAGGVSTDASTGYTWSRPEDQPGYEWKNGRAREDEMRALESIVEKGAQIKTKYGDPLKAGVPMAVGR